MKYFYIKLFLYNFTFLNERKLMRQHYTIFFIIDLIWE